MSTSMSTRGYLWPKNTYSDASDSSIVGNGRQRIAASGPKIKYNQAAFVLHERMPTHWGQPTAVNLTITNYSGIELITAQAVTIASATTLSEASKKLAQSFRVASGSFESGDLIRIGTANEGYDLLVVRSFDADNRIIVTEKRADFDHTSGSDVVHRSFEIAIDTTSSDFILANQVMLEWVPTGISELSFTQLSDIVKRTIDWGGLKADFTTRYPRLIQSLPDANDFTEMRDMAYQRLQAYFEMHSLNIARAVDSDAFKESMILEIAYLICGRGGEGIEDELETVKEFRVEQQNLIKQTFVWIDSNQDKILDDQEIVKAPKQRIWRRGL